MIIVHTDETKFVPAKNLQKLMYDRDLIRQLARQLVANQVEAHLEMGYDCGSEYKTHTEAAAMIEGAKETVHDYVADLMAEFTAALNYELRDVKIKVKSTSFSAEGFEDAVVEVL